MNSSTTTFVDQLPRLLPDDELVQLAAGLTAVPSFTGQETPLAFHVRNTLAATTSMPTTKRYSRADCRRSRASARSTAPRRCC
ncbi:hypothetical protein ACQPW1_45690 [Nocardia sp. CA-128927]|uniref:hypothetical protein n=1 Tax=Nocardia sp. CA-128927 TaxID=3239975 RepID=UPI003D980F29